MTIDEKKHLHLKLQKGKCNGPNLRKNLVFLNKISLPRNFNTNTSPITLGENNVIHPNLKLFKCYARLRADSCVITPVIIQQSAHATMRNTRMTLPLHISKVTQKYFVFKGVLQYATQCASHQVKWFDRYIDDDQIHENTKALSFCSVELCTRIKTS